MKVDKDTKKAIIILGPPGSGKGTQGVLLAEKINAFYFETSALIEKMLMNSKKDAFVIIKGKKYFLQEQKKLWREGKLCDPEFVIFFVLKKVKELIKKKESIVFSGSPRTLLEAQKLIPLLIKFYGKNSIKVCLFVLSEEASIFRNSHRRICQLFRHPILFSSETKKLKKCPLDGSPLLKRALDKPEIIKERLQEYQKRTLPLLEYFRKEKLKIFRIDASPSPAFVFKEILKKLNLK